MPVRDVVVDKIGGGVLRDSVGYQRAAEYQIRLFEERYSPVAFVSAMHGVTDMLVGAEEPIEPGPESIKKLRNELEGLYFPILEKNLGSENSARARRELIEDIDDLCYLLGRRDEGDKWRIHAKGERHSAIMMKYHIREGGYDALWLDGYDTIIATPVGAKQAGAIKQETYYRSIPGKVMKHLNPRLMRIPIICGFGAREAGTGNFITLGRNSSDYSGAAGAKALRAVRYEIIKEEPTVFRVDPKLLRNKHVYGPRVSKETIERFRLDKLSYSEGVELTSKGAKVVHPMALDLCEVSEIPIMVKNLDDGGGHTLIGKDSVTNQESPVAAMHAAVLPILTVEDRRMSTPEGRGYESLISEIIAENEIDVHNMTDSSTTVSHIISKEENNGFPVDEIMGGMLRDSGHLPSKVIRDNIGYICIVGDGMKKRPGTTADITGLLKRMNISLRTVGHCDEHADVPALNIGVSKDDFYKAVKGFCDEGIFFKDFWKG
jgi:aspartate kinase